MLRTGSSPAVDVLVCRLFSTATTPSTWRASAAARCLAAASGAVPFRYTVPFTVSTSTAVSVAALSDASFVLTAAVIAASSMLLPAVLPVSVVQPLSATATVNANARCLPALNISGALLSQLQRSKSRTAAEWPAGCLRPDLDNAQPGQVPVTFARCVCNLY